MDNDSKNVLMQYLYRFADHEGIEGAELISFRKRDGLLARLKARNHDAWVVIMNLFNAFIAEDRINNDREKKDKAFPLWESEHAAAEREKVKAEQDLIRYCKENDITIGKINATLQG